jgi:predicted TPR repeat methyltransferase
MDNLQVIADMGCGAGLDANWWATVTTRDEPHDPRNYLVYAVDQNTKQLETDVPLLPNVKVIEGNFEDRVVPRQIDLLWAHDVFQYSLNPLKCLQTWKSSMNVNGMLILSVPQTTYYKNNRLTIANHSGQYYSYNILNLMYMLALSGFDCRDAYFYRKRETPWLYAAVYATEHEPLDSGATWYDLAERNLINDSVVASVNKYGHARIEDIVVAWLDRDFYTITD